MIEPRYQSLKILGFGSSKSTNEPLEAEIIVVRSYIELEQRSNEVVFLKLIKYWNKTGTYFRFLVK